MVPGGAETLLTLLKCLKCSTDFLQYRLKPFFQLDLNNRTRGNTAKIKKNRCRTDLRKHFFSESVVNKWNSLKEETIQARTINSFNRHLDKERSTRMDLFMD